MIASSLKWRINYARQLGWKARWKLKSVFDFSETVPVTAVSVVVVGRNDNYGGDFTARLRTTLDWNLSHLPNPELIYVEWNQLKDRKSDCEWIAQRYPNSRCYIVPNEIHQSIAADPRKMPVMEYFGKNLGIRKATTDWIILINADVFLAPDAIEHIRRLNKRTVYGTHYVSIRWDGNAVDESHLNDKKLITVAFPVEENLFPVSGNFLMTHRQNWIEATGYDESLTHIRAGVDSNGVAQLLHSGLRQQVLGHHFHLDHPESIVNQSNETHGAAEEIRLGQNIPYHNPEGWGMINYPLKKLNDRIWELQKI